MPLFPEMIGEVLIEISNKPIQVYNQFPGIVKIGSSLYNKVDIDFLLYNGFLEKKANSSLGYTLQLSELAKKYIDNRN